MYHHTFSSQRGSISFGLLDHMTLIIIALLCAIIAFNNWGTWYSYLGAAIAAINTIVVLYLKITGTGQWPK